MACSVVAGCGHELRRLDLPHRFHLAEHIKCRWVHGLVFEELDHFRADADEQHPASLYRLDVKVEGFGELG